MALVLHKLLADGSVIHEDFDRRAWEAALHDETLVKFWGHPPGDCKDPVQHIRERQGLCSTQVPEVPPEPAKLPPLRVMGPAQGSFDFGGDS